MTPGECPMCSAAGRPGLSARIAAKTSTSAVPMQNNATPNHTCKLFDAQAIRARKSAREKQPVKTARTGSTLCVPLDIKVIIQTQRATLAAAPIAHSIALCVPRTAVSVE